MLERIKKQDWLITFLLGVLCLVSILLIYSTTIDAQNPLEGQNTVYKQIIFFVIGFGFYFAISAVDLSWLKQRGVVIAIYAFILLALIYVLQFAQVVEQTQRWIALGPLSFQPAEFAKLAIVIATAYIYSVDIDSIESNQKLFELEQSGEINWEIVQEYIKRFMISGTIAGVYAFLIVMQPSLGNAVIFVFIWGIVTYAVLPISKHVVAAAVMFVITLIAYYKIGFFADFVENSFFNDIQWKIFVLFAFVMITIALVKLFKYKLVGFIVAFVLILGLAPTVELGWNYVLKDYQRERIEAYMDGFSSDPQDSGFQVQQSVISFGSGSIFGQGYLNNITIPFDHTDFIFSAFGRQFGYIGVIMIFFLYAMLVYRMFKILLVTSDIFGKVIIIGIAAIVVINLFISVAMTMGQIPVTGVPLPLISYGGSSVLLVMICFGLVQMVGISTESSDLVEKISI